MNSCLITCHGFSGYPEEMEPMGRYFENKGFDWKNLTLPGHNSTPEALKETKWKDWTEYVDKNIKKSLSQYDNVVFSGLSLGGAMTLYALEHHKDLTAGIALAPPWKILKWYQEVLTWIPFINFWIDRSDKDIADIQDPDSNNKHRAYRKIHTKSIRELSDFVKFVRSNLHLIDQPVLVVHSKKDRVLPFSHSKRIMQNIGSHQKVFFPVKNSGHVLTRDHDKDIIFEKSLNFVRKFLNQS